MKNRLCQSHTLAGFLMCTALAVLLLNVGLMAQQPASNSINIQREAMHKLAFLAGQWSGPVTITRGPGASLHLTQSEEVQYKLDGLVLLIQGKSTGADGEAQFQALATVAYDDETQSYRFRAYHDGHYIDTELSLLADGFSWGFTAGPAHIVNTMHLTHAGEWQETTDVTMGSGPPRRSMDMLLQRRQ
jgi:hypothetical protein